MRRTISTLVVLLACAGTVPGVRAYLGEDPGLNLYRTVDRSSGQLEARLMEKYLNGSGNRANRLIGKACQGE